MASVPAPQAPTPCSVCDGTGWKTVLVPNKASRLTRCDCWKNSRLGRVLRTAEIPSRYQNCTLENFETDFPEASFALGEACLIAKSFVRDYPLEKLGLLLTGPIGVGKTHLAVGILKDLIQKKAKHQCLFCDYRELLKKIQNSYNPQVQATELEILSPVFDAEVLLLDELGAVKPTEWVWDTVSFILNSRYNEKKTTIITTNYPDAPSHKGQAETEQRLRRKSQQRGEADAAIRDETLGDRITDRMWSRLHEMCRIINLDGMDFRTLSSPHNYRRR